MIVLGIDTASSVCVVSALSAGRVVAVRTSSRPRAHAESLMGMIDECLNAVTPGLRKPDAVAVSGGPGSFAGLRIGFSVAKGICSALGSALIVVPTFEAWALAAAELSGAPEESLIITVMSAGRGATYESSFRRTGDGVVRLSGPSVTPTGTLPGLLPGKTDSCFIVGESRAELTSWFPSPGETRFLGIAEDALDTAARVASIGATRLGSGPASDPVTAEPMYVRNFPTTSPNEKGGKS